MEAGVIGLRRCRQHPRSRDAVLVLSNARCRQRGRADGQRRCSDCQAHRVSPLSGVSFRRKGVQARGRIQAARVLIRHKPDFTPLTIPDFCGALQHRFGRVGPRLASVSPLCHSAGAAPCDLCASARNSASFHRGRIGLPQRFDTLGWHRRAQPSVHSQRSRQADHVGDLASSSLLTTSCKSGTDLSSGSFSKPICSTMLIRLPSSHARLLLCTLAQVVPPRPSPRRARSRC